MAIKPRKYWENGTSLRRAFIDFYGYPSNDGDREKVHYTNLCKPAVDGSSGPDDPNFYAYAPKADFHREPLRNAYRNKFCVALLNQLRAGQLIATGKQSSPERKSDIDKIPIAQIPAFDPGSRDVDGLPVNEPICNEWDRDEFFGIAAQYREVRISDPKKNSEGIDKRTSIPKSRNLGGTRGYERPGRPTNADLILKAYENCKSDGLLDFSKPQASAITIIRHYLQRNYPDVFGSSGAGFSDKTIARIIKNRFNADAGRF